MKVILLIDGDNIDESYTTKLMEAAQTFGDVYEAHCFSDFVKRKQGWKSAYSEYKIQLHYIPGSEKQKGKPDPNTSDIALAIFAMERLYELPDIDICIIAANDKDYIPLAKAIREKFHKKAVMLYTQQSDKAVTSYDEAVLLCDNEIPPTQNDGVATAAGSLVTDANEFYQFKYAVKVANCIEEHMTGKSCVYLSFLGPYITATGIEYGESLGRYLDKLFNTYPWLSDKYTLKLGDKKDRIERIA